MNRFNPFHLNCEEKNIWYSMHTSSKKNKHENFKILFLLKSPKKWEFLIYNYDNVHVHANTCSLYLI